MGFIYRSRRVGLDGKVFWLYKLRTMRQDGGCPTAASDDGRLTPLGRHLRRLKLDELPTLLNLLKGDIRLVGPRPDTPSEIDALDFNTQVKTLSVPPGLTSPATLWNCNEDELLKGLPDPHEYYCRHIRPMKYRLNVWYVENRTLWLDIKIAAATALRLMRLNPDLKKWGVLPAWSYELRRRGEGMET